MTEATPSTMRRDIVSAYVVVGAKVIAWAIVSAIVFTRGGETQFALLTLVRSTLGLLAYVVLGIAPAMIRMIAEATQVRALTSDELDIGPVPSGVLAYARPTERTREDPVSTIYANGLVLATAFVIVGIILIGLYAHFFPQLHRSYMSRQYTLEFVWNLGLGLLLRLASDACGALLQVRRAIWVDNLILAFAELLWPLLTLLSLSPGYYSTIALTASQAFAKTGVLLLFFRFLAAAVLRDRLAWRNAPVRASIMWALMAYGAIVTVAQLADFLYAPTDFILINRLLSTIDAANYAPAVQIDAALLLSVGAIASVLLPKAALAHARNDVRLIRKYYVRGTLASIGILLCAGGTCWLSSRWLFIAWFEDPMFGTRAILPLVLIHTVVGGSSAVGRSILLGMGKVKPFTLSVLIAGVANVVLSYIFVRYFDLGLRGIVLGTIIAVVARCAIWMPWYVLKTLRTQSTPNAN